MNFTPAAIILYPLGWVYLWLRYRNREKVAKILTQEYGNSYYAAGLYIIFKTFGIVFICLLLLLIITCIISIFRFEIS